LLEGQASRTHCAALPNGHQGAWVHLIPLLRCTGPGAHGKLSPANSSWWGLPICHPPSEARDALLILVQGCSISPHSTWFGSVAQVGIFYPSHMTGLLHAVCVPEMPCAPHHMSDEGLAEPKPLMPKLEFWLQLCDLQEV
jgi:hypothetical protein